MKTYRHLIIDHHHINWVTGESLKGKLSQKNENSVIIYSPLCRSKSDFLSSAEHKRRYFEKCLILFFPYNGSQWQPKLVSRRRKKGPLYISCLLCICGLCNCVGLHNTLQLMLF